ncbi:MAG: photosystem I reaction center protein subunit XI [Leptolyngbyaceae cyanobacterium SM1_3_5]|nr:photosystem I reaction center protein subunit XI [Leptolyngbyaceae cyanobacterium SM1_3_5]
MTTVHPAKPEFANAELIKPYKGDSSLGNLSTPINDSALVRAYIRNLPAYRPGLTPYMRGLEIGLAHGYFLVGPEVVVGPLRETVHGANLSGLITAIYITVSACLGISIFAIATFQGSPYRAYSSPNDDLRPLRRKEEWFQLSGGIFIGAIIGAFFAYWLLENFDAIDSSLRGGVNVSQLLCPGSANTNSTQSRRTQWQTFLNLPEPMPRPGYPGS